MARYTVCEGVFSRREEDKMFVLNQQNAQVLILNPTAAALWEHCAEEGLDSAKIPEVLASSFDFSGNESELETATEDALSHLELLAKAGFLERIS